MMKTFIRSSLPQWRTPVILALLLFFAMPVAAAEWIARHGLTGAQYQQHFTDYADKGFRLASVSGYENGGAVLYAALWIKKAGPAWAARHGLTGAQYQQAVNDMVKQGFALTHVSAYSVGGSPRFAAIFEKESPPWVARHGLSAADYQKAFNDFANQGYRLKVVSGYRDGNSDRYAAIWTKSGGLQWSARHGVPQLHYQHVFDNYRYQGWEPVYIEAFSSSSGPRFNGIWENGAMAAKDLALIGSKVQAYMKKHDVPGLTIAISRDERLVYAAGFGLADKEKGEPVGPAHRFRIASVSKPITAVAVMRLVEGKRLELTDKVFGSNSLLGSQYSTPSNNTKIADITVRDLLQHAGGFATENGDPMFAYTGTDHKGLIGWALKQYPLAVNPGERYEYSNFGYCLLGRIIEAKTGRSYEAYVRDAVLKPAGATAMLIGGDKETDRNGKEAKYYGSGAYSSVKPVRFDSHGGWIATPIDLLRFIARVDGFTNKTDLLNATSLTTMTTKSGITDKDGVDRNYAFGWGISGSSYGHNGAMAGTIAELGRRGDGFAFAAAVNTRPEGDKFAGELKKMLNEIIDEVSSWPKHDLF